VTIVIAHSSAKPSVVDPPAIATAAVMAAWRGFASAALCRRPGL
jgi:hypothetical protein